MAAAAYHTNRRSPSQLALRLSFPASSYRMGISKFRLGADARIGLYRRPGQDFHCGSVAGGADMRILAFLTDPGPVDAILRHLGRPTRPAARLRPSGVRLSLISGSNPSTPWSSTRRPGALILHATKPVSSGPAFDPAEPELEPDLEFRPEPGRLKAELRLAAAARTCRSSRSTGSTRFRLWPRPRWRNPGPWCRPWRGGSG
jgi:hypothetical protein